MKLGCEIEVKSTKDKIWPYYTEFKKRLIWEEDLESLVFNGDIETGTKGKMKLKDMPEMEFILTEIISNSSYCDKTNVPGIGSLFFKHKIFERDGKTFIEHSVDLEKEDFNENDLEFLKEVFSDVPSSMLKIKKEVEK